MNNTIPSTVEDQLLFTPGPLKTTRSVKAAAMKDIGSRTHLMRDVTLQIIDSLQSISELSSDYAAVLMQGSGTFSVEAMISSLLDEQAQVLILLSGEYSQRMADICDVYRIPNQVLTFDEELGICPNTLRDFLQTTKTRFSHLLFVHYETALGVVNPYDAVMEVANQYALKVMVDCVSSFGLLPVFSSYPNLIALASSANKCLQGLTGVSFVLVHRDELHISRRKRTLSFDLKAQHDAFIANGEWRFSPPVQVLLAFQQALFEYTEKGGRQQQYRDYLALRNYLDDKLVTLGIYPVIDKAISAPIINTYSLPSTLEYGHLARTLAAKNIVIYASKRQGCFRIGTAGDITRADIDRLTTEIRAALEVCHEQC
ncbi:aminotransferase class V-fold PLP-dependent enzyme [Vibrio ouci]|uniref:Aminotransferase class V-fold PLP-dependent enzyme n=1 Tax=Vibrio ouci TaxID=2499078 RepID=A0A4Y8WBE9_9VIBR|nr:aminotransferase class V-fold PLP-dependent enzyme [Vibrio ouci]TFH89601.1 aminotransferase class V-fold PLP-dependent enzyme [Vibrio ouci]